jgi:Asp-tRNA(Asn)/Glu-tRNA(Gln) amidotransferase A subunit family amidase
MIDGLPALMLVGKHWDESTIYKAARRLSNRATEEM